VNFSRKEQAAKQLRIFLIDGSPVAKLKLLYSLDILKLPDTSGKLRQPSQEIQLIFHCKSSHLPKTPSSYTFENGY